jgi:peptide/nickel transport system permease protein
MKRPRASQLFAVAWLALLLLAAAFADVLAPIESTRQDLSSALIPPVGFGGTIDHPLGTDQVGRDLLARMIRGARVSTMVGLATVLLAGAVGLAAGFVAAWVGGRVDMVVTGLGEVQQAFPGSMLALVLLLALGPSVWTVVFVIALAGWVVFARVVRGLTLSLKQEPYVDAAVVLGASPSRLILLHLLPNLAPSLLTLATLEFAAAILSESAYSFLGFGIKPTETSWGLIIAQGRNYLASGWWIIAFPGLAIAITVFATNLLAGWWSQTEQPVITEPRSRRRKAEDDPSYAAGSA